MTTSLLRTARTALHRIPARASYDRDVAYRIIDEALFCSVGIVVDGQPYVLPMAHARLGDDIVLHGAAASRLLGNAASSPTCVSFTLLDGLVLARSAMHHSLNFRSLVVLGAARPIVDEAEKTAALARLIEHLVEGRTRDVRPPNAKELAATKVLALPLQEASIKIREGGPVDDEADLALPCWAGVLPLTLVPSSPVPAQHLAHGTAVPRAIAHYERAARSKRV